MARTLGNTKDACGTAYMSPQDIVGFYSRKLSRKLVMRIIVCLCMPVFLHAGVGIAGAAEPTSKAESIRIGSFDLPPWGWEDQDGSRHGIIFDLHQDIAVRTGLRFMHSMYPFSRVVEMLRKGELDMISGQPHKDLLEAGEKLVLLHTINIIAVAKKGSGIRSVQDLRDKIVVYQRVASYPQLQGLPRQIIRVDSYEQSTQILYARPGVDAAVFSEPSFYYFLKKLGLKREDFGEIIYVERNREDWLFVSRSLPQEVKSSLKKAVEEATRDGMYKKLLAEYCGLSVP